MTWCIFGVFAFEILDNWIGLGKNKELVCCVLREDSLPRIIFFGNLSRGRTDARSGAALTFSFDMKLPFNFSTFGLFGKKKKHLMLVHHTAIDDEHIITTSHYGLKY